MNVSERRGERRYVVEGLHAALDGITVEILDVAPTAIHVWWVANRPLPQWPSLTLWSEPGRPRIRTTVPARLVRASGREAVYAYPAPRAEWPRVLAQFDTFAEFAVPALEG